MRTFASIIALALLATVGLKAQECAALSGVVTTPDGNGIPLQGAMLVVQPGSYADTTNAQGQFVFPCLSPGIYTITISYGANSYTMDLNMPDVAKYINMSIAE